MTREQILENSETYKQQVFKVLDPEKTEIRFNSEWLMKLDYEQIVRLCSLYTVARLLERDDFSKRYSSGQPISMHELLYPLAQAYDSVMLEADVELGGTDQKFNLLVGREIQKDFGQPPQIIATTRLLEGTDGVQKMSKSLGNYIGVTEPADVMYRKVMQVNDELMFRYYELLTDLPMAEILGLRQDVAAGRRHPREVKADLARRIVTEFHSTEDADAGAEAFRKVVQQGQIPDDVPEFGLPETARVNGSIRIDKLLREIGLCSSAT
jgi:tyrosyl-tRNA synthetase